MFFRMLSTGALLTAVMLSAAQAQDTGTSTRPSDTTTGTRTPTTTTTTSRADDRGFNLGWIGLAGLAGLAGLMRNDTSRVGSGYSTSTSNRRAEAA